MAMTLKQINKKVQQLFKESTAAWDSFPSSPKTETFLPISQSVLVVQHRQGGDQECTGCFGVPKSSLAVYVGHSISC